jgi:glycerophosphoryl diester phosphodiesterase
LIYLAHKSFKSIKSTTKHLTIQPYALGLYYSTISKREIIKAHELGMAVFAWTVNSFEDFKRLKRQGIDGIITDYPGNFIKR